MNGNRGFDVGFGPGSFAHDRCERAVGARDRAWYGPDRGRLHSRLIRI